MQLNMNNLQIVDICTTTFNTCQSIENTFNREVRPIEETIHKMVDKTTSIVKSVAAGKLSSMKLIRGVLVINAAINTCTEKITMAEKAIGDIEKNINKLIHIQSFDVSQEMIEFIVSTIKNIRFIQNNIREDLIETATERGYHVRARNLINAKLNRNA